MEEHIRLLEQKLEAQNENMLKMMQTITELNERMKESEANRRGDGSGAVPNQARVLGYVPKIDFPKFDGNNSRMWIKKCNKYFSLCKIPEDQKVDLACLNMVDKAENWVTNYLAVRRNVEWSEFIIDVSARFKDEFGANVVENFNKLQQTGTIESYLDEFENLRSLLLQQNQVLPDSYFLDSFVGGLKSTLKPFVRAFKPSTLAEAVKYARLQEESLEASHACHNLETSWTKISEPVSKSLPALLPTPPPAFKLNSVKKTLSAAERRDKQMKGLCYFCDQPYEKGHKCGLKQTQLFSVEISGMDEDEEEKSDCKDQCFELVNMELSVSRDALSGNQKFHTMRVTGYVNDKPLYILVDPGSTHNFLDLGLAKRMGWHLDSIPDQEVTVVHGVNILCQFVCKDFAWRLHDIIFKSDMFLIPLGSYDMILGIQWLSKLGTIAWNFKRLSMEFDVGACHCRLNGVIQRGVG